MKNTRTHAFDNQNIDVLYALDLDENVENTYEKVALYSKECRKKFVNKRFVEFSLKLKHKSPCISIYLMEVMSLQETQDTFYLLLRVSLV